MTAGHVTTLWVKRLLLVNQHGQLSQPSLRGRNDGLRRPTYCWLVLPVPVGGLPCEAFGCGLWAVA